MRYYAKKKTHVFKIPPSPYLVAVPPAAGTPRTAHGRLAPSVQMS